MMSAMASWKADTSAFVWSSRSVGPVDQGVRHLVADDVVRQAGVDRLAREVPAGVV